MCSPDAYHHLIRTARTLYANEPSSSEFASLMGATVYALDSTTIDLCFSIFNWAPFRTTKAAIKLRLLWETWQSLATDPYLIF